MKIGVTATSKLHEVLTFEMDLLTSYVNRIEKDVKEGIASYKSKINVVHEEEHIEDNQVFYQVIEECEGVDGSTWSFESVFEDYFPRLQRSSALITLCSFFEHTLIRLCNDLQKENSLALNIKDIKGKGIELAFTYLTKVVGIKLDRQSKNFIEIKNIQEVRNSFVHADGFINDKIKNYVVANEFLKGESVVTIEFGFLKYVLCCYKNIFELIHGLLNDREKERKLQSGNSN